MITTKAQRCHTDESASQKRLDCKAVAQKGPYRHVPMGSARACGRGVFMEELPAELVPRRVAESTGGGDGLG